MTNRFVRIGIAISIGLYSFVAHGTSLLSTTTERHIQSAAGIFRGTVVDLQSYEDSNGMIFTRAVFRVDETFKGKLPSLIKIAYRGGSIGNRGEMSGSSLNLHLGDERLMLVSRGTGGALFATRGDASALNPKGDGQKLLSELRAGAAGSLIEGSDLTDQAASSQSFAATSSQSNVAPSVNPSSGATNLIVDGSGIPARFVLPDRGEPIPYLIDADYLPTGITQTQAVSAVQTALAAWTNVTSIRFKFAGIQSFGKAAPNVTNTDGYLRIQLHDHYNFISSGGFSGDVLGDGGHSWSVLNLSAGWTTGGNVSGNDFHKVVRGYLVLQHTNVFMQNLANFTEVLTHEIGHTIGLGHSSQSPTESNPILNQAIMYYMAHGDGRGATLNSFDINVSRQIHPVGNTPPYCLDRVLDVVTSSVRPINVAGVNSAQVRGYDLQNSALTFATNSASSGNGSFSLANNTITYVPKSFFPDQPRLDPASGASYDLIYARYSDGVHASPYATIRVISFNADSYNEGIPDSWRQSYFGNANPSVGTKHHANDDADGDGISNLQEFLCGTVPTNSASTLRISGFSGNTIQWQAKGYEVYEVLSSSNFVNWTRSLSPRAPTNSLGFVNGCTNGSPKQFFRVTRVP